MMATAKFSETLSEFITCSVCFEEFEGRDPRSLSCLHAFCRVCIERLLNTAGKQNIHGKTTITCPICNSAVEIPGGSPANLPRFFYGEGIREAVSSLQKQSITCKICKKAKVTRYCIDCKAVMCQACKAKHDTLYATQHADICITESTVKHLVCPDHDEHINSFCVECMKPVCHSCLISNHCDHKVSQLTNKKAADEADELTAVFNERIVLFNIQLEKLITIQEEFTKEMKKTKQDLDRHHAQCISELNRQHQSLSAEIEEELMKVNQELSALITNIIDSIENIQKMQQRMEKLLQPFPDVPDLALDCTQDLVSETLEQINIPPAITSKPASLTFVRSSEAMFLGELQTGQFSLSASLSAFDMTSVATNYLFSGESCPSFAWKGPSGVKDVKFLPDGQLLIFRFKQLRVLDMDGKYTPHPIGKLHRGNINHIAVDEKMSSIAVVSYEKPDCDGYLDLYECKNDNWNATDFEICNHPDSVAFTEEGNIIVGDNSGYLYMYNADGEEIWKRKLSSSAKCITVTKQQVLVGHNNKMVAYHINGKKLFTVSCRNEQEDIEVSGICINSEGNILIADRKTKAIHLFDKNGHYCRQIFSLRGKPECMAMFRDEYLAVVISYRPYVYKL